MTSVVPIESLNHPRTLAAFRRIRLLVAGYVAVSVATLLAIVVLRNDAAEVNSAVWTRGVIVVLTALLLARFTSLAARGSRPAYRRLRIISTVTVVAITVIIALPGTFPAWMKIEQGVCGIIMLAVACTATGGHLRSLYGAGSSSRAPG